jgi:hypothetical protein
VEGRLVLVTIKPQSSLSQPASTSLNTYYFKFSVVLRMSAFRASSVAKDDAWLIVWYATPKSAATRPIPKPLLNK